MGADGNFPLMQVGDLLLSLRRLPPRHLLAVIIAPLCLTLTSLCGVLSGPSKPRGL